LIPFGATATGNVNVTAGLALITFFTTQIFAKKDYWKHIFATPGVPLWLSPIMIPVEIMGLFTKPFALTMRLFANMTAGHVIILALIGLIINFKSYGVALGAVPGAMAIFGLELFVALLQAYVFTLLSSMFIGAAVQEHEHHEHQEAHH
ncbi:F0F1 ATP synthase subunit A, partial [bacterium]|nr:F0F1 ATP synthase subunit A [bacterium]